MSSGLDGELIVELRFASRADRLRLVRSVVGEVARDSGCSEKCVRDMVIAVDEACQNVIRHAYRGAPDGEIRLEIRRESDRIAFNLVDFAEPVDEASIRPRALEDLRPGGLGTHFIHECMDEARPVARPRRGNPGDHRRRGGLDEPGPRRRGRHQLRAAAG